MEKEIFVFKFGGTSLKDEAGFRRVVEIIKQHAGKSLLIVISALGKMTNALEEVVALHAQKDQSALDQFQVIKQTHFDLAQKLVPGQPELLDQLNDLFVEADWVLEDEPHPDFDYMYDQVVCIGELASSTILNAFLSKEGLQTQWLDARDVILTDDIYREGWVQWPQTLERMKNQVPAMLAQNELVITQGFIGSTTDNNTTTLGREGSDFSAAIFSYGLNAVSMTIWKDVPGVLTADPSLFDNTILLPELSYREAIEMTYYGAKVIHPKTIKPLQNKNIPLYVRSFLDSEGAGTKVHAESDTRYPPIIAVEQNQALIKIGTKDFSFVAVHHMRRIFRAIDDCRLHLNLMQNTAISFSICVTHFSDRVQTFLKILEADFNIQTEDDLQLISIRHSTPGIIEAVKEGKIVLVEERIENTVQMVVKEVPALRWKA